MASFSYKLRGNTIQIDFSYSRTIRLRKGTNIKINNSKNWNSKSNTVRDCPEEPTAKEINFKLSNIRNTLLQSIADLEHKGFVINKTLLNQTIDSVLGLRKSSEENEIRTFNQLFERFAYADSSFRSPNTGEILKPSTIRSYNATWKNLLKFSKDTRYDLQWNTVNREFYDLFLNWCQNKGLTDNTHGKFIKIIKSIMNTGLELELHTNIEHKKKYFKKSDNPSDAIYLTESELDRLFKLDLPDNSLIRNVRDLFLIAANTGLRWSDYKRISEFEIINEGDKKYITLLTQKNQIALTIPLKPSLHKIISSDLLKKPLKITEYQFKSRIQLLGKMIGLDELVKSYKIFNGKKVITECKKYELIGTHTARRSFCTNAFLSGMDPAKIMLFSGHKQLDTFNRYIKSDSLKNARMLSNEGYFQ